MNITSVENNHYVLTKAINIVAPCIHLYSTSTTLSGKSTSHLMIWLCCAPPPPFTNLAMKSSTIVLTPCPTLWSKARRRIAKRKGTLSLTRCGGVSRTWARAYNPRTHFDQDWIQQSPLDYLHLYRLDKIAQIKSNGSELDFTV